MAAPTPELDCIRSGLVLHCQHNRSDIKDGCVLRGVMRCDAMRGKEGGRLRFFETALLRPQHRLGGCTGQEEHHRGTALALPCCGGTSKFRASTGTVDHLADTRYRGTPAAQLPVPGAGAREVHN